MQCHLQSENNLLVWLYYLNKYATNLAVFGELGRFPFIINIITSILTYWLRVRKLDNSVLVKKAFLDDTKLCVNDKHSFIFQMVMLFKLDGLDTTMLLHPGMSIDNKSWNTIFSKLCGKNLKDKFQQ